MEGEGCRAVGIERTMDIKRAMGIESKKEGVEYGPAAVREAGLLKRLSKLGKCLGFQCSGMETDLFRTVFLILALWYQLCTWTWFVPSGGILWIPSADEHRGVFRKSLGYGVK
ncbi:hypothetical protein U0070_013739 [Myodes glareolus]|uniref:Uncharacterized protein n=1 Tax=Myodes glareolus TaxID=447135 RepID=A0AAW0I985_MYOGA